MPVDELQAIYTLMCSRPSPVFPTRWQESEPDASCAIMEAALAIVPVTHAESQSDGSSKRASTRPNHAGSTDTVVVMGNPETHGLVDIRRCREVNFRPLDFIGYNINPKMIQEARLIHPD